ncbi:MAG: AfsA-related hotdog domain-containing protein [Myxococcota bacterium]
MSASLEHVNPVAPAEPSVERVLHVVGDKFSFFAEENPGIMTVSEFEHLIDKGGIEQPVSVFIGQGVSKERLELLEQRLARSRTRRLATIKSAPVRDRCPGKYTHKHYDRNTIISTPVQLEGEDIFRAELILDDLCAEMSDHVTGHHLQGIVFFEAARQMFLAVTERFWLERLKRPYYFVINEFNTTYHTFGFPLPTELTLKVVSERTDNRKTGAVFLDVRVEFFQVGVPITECFIKFAAFDKQLLSAREGLLARLALLKLSPTLSVLDDGEA